MTAFPPDLIKTMCAVLEEVMQRVPLEQATSGTKAHIAELILRAAADGETSHAGLREAAWYRFNRSSQPREARAS
jgi:hypothetical protein